MHSHFRNVNDAFEHLVHSIHYGHLPTVKKPSRYGEVLSHEEPVIVTYKRPKERVLFNEARDCNPFALLYEAMWTLAGRNDVAPLAYYFKRASEFSDDGMTWNDAYGYRWMSGPYLGKGIDYPRGREDQLKVLIDHLKSKPESRRAVLQMWNVEDDLLKIDTSKAVCCNLNVLFSLRDTCDEADDGTYPWPKYKVLDMTVFNRSNDMIWGMLGANVVVFSILQEYVAAHLGVEVGVYHQVTNNLHVYTDNWEPDKWIAGSSQQYPLSLFSLVEDLARFDYELPFFVEANKNGMLIGTQGWDEPFLDKVAQPLCNAFHAHKLKNYDGAMIWAGDIQAEDWKVAAKQWLQRRIERRNKV